MAYIAVLCLAQIATAGCRRSDEHYVDLVRKHLRGGPAAACCTIDADVLARSDPGRKARCVADAPRTCAFVEGGVVKPTSVFLAPHTYNSGWVEVDIEGPHGRGHCRFNVTEHAVQDGTCTAL